MQCSASESRAFATLSLWRATALCSTAGKKKIIFVFSKIFSHILQYYESSYLLSPKITCLQLTSKLIIVFCSMTALPYYQLTWYSYLHKCFSPCQANNRPRTNNAGWAADIMTQIKEHHATNRYWVFCVLSYYYYCRQNCYFENSLFYLRN